MKNDIKTSSTDFLPQKPDADLGSGPANSANSAATVDLSDKSKSGTPANMPTSAHVIDLKNNEKSTPVAQPPTDPATSKDFMVKNNPFMDSPNTEDGDQKTESGSPMPSSTLPANPKEDLKTKDFSEDAKIEPVSQKTETVDQSLGMARDKKLEEAKIDVKNTSAEPKEEVNKAGTVLTLDVAHSKEETDTLKEAMVDHDDSVKPKRKLPIWLTVLIVVVAIVIVAVITFVLLNFLARPAGF